MKLELKYLAPYLPYGLNGVFTLSEVISLGKYQKDEVREKYLNDDCITFFMENCKPILRPMSDLNKEIPNDSDGRTYNDLGCFTKYIFITSSSILIDINNMHYEDAIILFENHFDVFELIEKGLAIDINSLPAKG